MYQKILALALLAVFTLAPSGASAQFDEYCLNRTVVEQVRHPYDCRYFVLCVYGMGQEVACPFNPNYTSIWITERCKEGDPDSCVPGPVTTPEPTTTTEATTPTPPNLDDACKGVSFGVRQHLLFCWRYVICFQEQAFEQSCGSDNSPEVCLLGNPGSCNFSWQTVGGVSPPVEP